MTFLKNHRWVESGERAKKEMKKLTSLEKIPLRSDNDNSKKINLYYVRNAFQSSVPCAMPGVFRLEYTRLGSLRHNPLGHENKWLKHSNLFLSHPISCVSVLWHVW